MPVDLAAAERFVASTARLLDRHRLAVLLHGAPAEPVLATLRAYRNPDGGFGHALEPDVRGPESEPASTLHALEVLAEAGALADPMVADAAAWLASIAGDDGGVPWAMPAAAEHPHAPWMEPSAGASDVTIAFAAVLHEAGLDTPWLGRATAWSWARIEGADDEGGAYWVKFALHFLDHVADDARADEAIERLRPRIDADGTIPVAGGAADERLRPLDLSPRPGRRSRALFAPEQVDADLDRLEGEQAGDGGWTFDWLAWSAGQEVEWRGAVTVRAIATLRAHGRA